MLEWMLPRARSLATLAALALLLLLGVSWGWKQVSRPFPQKAETPICLDSVLDDGDTLRPAGMTVNVLNASGRNGLAGTTLDDLSEHGFGEGSTGDAPSGTRVSGAQIWSNDPESAAVRLLRSHLGGQVAVVDAIAAAPGLTVVLGEDFPGVRKGKNQVNVRATTTVCVPTAITGGAEVPVDDQDEDTDVESDEDSQDG